MHDLYLAVVDRAVNLAMNTCIDIDERFPNSNNDFTWTNLFDKFSLTEMVTERFDDSKLSDESRDKIWNVLYDNCATSHEDECDFK